MGALLWPGLSYAQLWGQAYSDRCNERRQWVASQQKLGPDTMHCMCWQSWWTGKIGLHSFQGYQKSSTLLYPGISSSSSSYIIIITIWLTGWLSHFRMFSSLGFQTPPPSTCVCSSFKFHMVHMWKYSMKKLPHLFIFEWSVEHCPQL